MSLQVAGVGECRVADEAAVLRSSVMHLGDVSAQAGSRYETLATAVAHVPES